VTAAAAPSTPASLRLARLLLVGAAAAAIGCVVVIVSRAAAVSPLLAFFVVAAVLFVAAARTLERDARGARLLAWAGAFSLAGVGVLAGFGAGDITFPAAGLGVLAAWSAALHPPRRRALIAFVAYVAIGALATAPRLLLAFVYPWTFATLFLWPWTALIAAPALGFALIYGSFGVAVALVAAYVSRRTGRSAAAPPALSLRASLASLAVGAAAVALFVALAYARQSTSARFELGPVPLAAVFVAGALAALGVGVVRSAPATGVVCLSIGGAVLLFSFLAEPTVQCVRGGGSTGPGPWWLAWPGGTFQSQGYVAPDGSAGGTIQRGDGRDIRYRCQDATVVEFEIR
jgi:hypothetical protein